MQNEIIQIQHQQLTTLRLRVFNEQVCYFDNLY